MHSQQSRRLIHWQAAVGTCGNVEMSDSRVSFVEEVDIAGRSGLGSGQMMRMVTSADYLHVHPPECSLVTEPKPTDYFLSLPLEEAGPKLGKLSRNEISAEAGLVARRILPVERQR